MKILGSFFQYGTDGHQVITEWEPGDVYSENCERIGVLEILVEKKFWACYWTDASNGRPVGNPVYRFNEINDAWSDYKKKQVQEQLHIDKYNLESWRKLA
jgi:hypothetical protein